MFLIPGFSTYRTNYVCGRQANISLSRNCSPYLVNFHLLPLASILVAILFRASWMLFGSSLRMSTLHNNRHTRNAPGSSMVPRRGLHFHLRFNSGRGHAPLFSVVSPTSRRLFPITYSHFCSFLSTTISAIVLVPAHYSPHSFHRCGASFASKCNVPAQLIHRQGDWERAAHFAYLNMSLEQKQLAVTTMADDILRLSSV